MRKSKPPPVTTKMMDANGNLDPSWHLWFQDIAKLGDNARKTPDLTYTTSVTLTTDDFGKDIVFDTSDGNLICTLMTVSARDLHGWLTIFRYGVSSLTIKSDAATRIEYGSYGTRIVNDEARRAAANVTLQLISATQWAITGATGLWKIS